MVIGLSVHTTPVEMREKLAIPEAEWPRAIAELCSLNHIEEAAVLSTCNRMEIYVVALSKHRGVKEVTEWMSKVGLLSTFIPFVKHFTSQSKLHFSPSIWKMSFMFVLLFTSFSTIIKIHECSFNVSY